MVRAKLRVVISGMIAGDPFQGGATWAVLQYILGLQNLGHEVLFVEPISRATTPADCPLAATRNATYFRHILERFGLEGRAALLQTESRETVGLSYAEIAQQARQSHLLINISGMLTDADIVANIPLRMYLDLDPAFNQLWATQGIDMRFDGHTHFVTIGLAMGRPECRVPACGRTWITTPQPIVLKFWPRFDANERKPLTTVANWRGYGSITHDGIFYGQKAHSLRQFVELPGLTREQFVLALAIHPDETRDLAALAQNGWKVIDPAGAVHTPDHYQRFIQASKAEFGIAKSGYVDSRCGWFSDRSLCYLASGRPVLAQETGFSRYLPTGEGLFSFRTLEDVVAMIDRMNENYGHHAQAARTIAEEYFDSDKVLARLLAEVGANS